MEGKKRVARKTLSFSLLLAFISAPEMMRKNLAEAEKKTKRTLKTVSSSMKNRSEEAIERERKAEKPRPERIKQAWKLY
jgi:hypothetical protein